LGDLRRQKSEDGSEEGDMSYELGVVSWELLVGSFEAGVLS